MTGNVKTITALLMILLKKISLFRILERRCLQRPGSRERLPSNDSSENQFFQRNLIIRTALFIAICFPADSELLAADTVQALDIQVQPDGFGKVSSRDISALLQSAAGEIWRHCPGTRLSGIDVYHRTDHPQTDFTRSPSGRIRIGLTATDTHWAQFAFQFGHEFCHTLANYANNERQFTRYPPQANFWLEECLCETASLFTLRAMSRSWETAPPFPSWQSYAPWLNAYAKLRLSSQEHQLPAGKPFPVWFQENEALLRGNALTRDRNTIIAIHLLHLFETEPRGWQAVTFLNRGDHGAQDSLFKHLTEWRSECPADLRPFVTKVAALFAVKL
jgi:hypothetical protein